jgi:hypothetical protein
MRPRLWGAELVLQLTNYETLLERRALPAEQHGHSLEEAPSAHTWVEFGCH